MIDYTDIAWNYLETFDYNIESGKDVYSITLRGFTANVILFEVLNSDYPIKQKIGTLTGLVSIKSGKKATLFTQDVFFGNNLIFKPNNVKEISELLFNQNRYYKGKFTLKTYKPSTAVQVIINPFTGQPVVLGLESLNAINKLDKQQNTDILKEIEKLIETNIKLTISEAITNNESINQIKGDIIDISAYLTNI
jgi:hypothetical protein